MTPTVKTEHCDLYLADCLDVLPTLRVDHIITDPPFSERTHRGHDASASGYLKALPLRYSRNGKAYSPSKDGAERKPLGYEAWTPEMVGRFVEISNGACDGWMVCMTDHTLAPAWAEAMSKAGRYVFAPLPYYAPGSRVRLSGDGPSSWTDWIIVSRTAKQSRWGTLPGGYMPKSDYGKHFRMGGKPVGLMVDLVADYSRQGELVCDPCAGSGTTAIACIRKGRKCVAIEMDEQYFEVMVNRVQEAEGIGGLFDPFIKQSTLFEPVDG